MQSYARLGGSGGGLVRQLDLLSADFPNELWNQEAAEWLATTVVWSLVVPFCIGSYLFIHAARWLLLLTIGVLVALGPTLVAGQRKLTIPALVFLFGYIWPQVVNVPSLLTHLGEEAGGFYGFLMFCFLVPSTPFICVAALYVLVPEAYKRALTQASAMMPNFIERRIFVSHGEYVHVGAEDKTIPIGKRRARDYPREEAAHTQILLSHSKQHCRIYTNGEAMIILDRAGTYVLAQKDETDYGRPEEDLEVALWQDIEGDALDYCANVTLSNWQELLVVSQDQDLPVNRINSVTAAPRACATKPIDLFTRTWRKYAVHALVFIAVSSALVVIGWLHTSGPILSLWEPPPLPPACVSCWTRSRPRNASHAPDVKPGHGFLPRDHTNTTTTVTTTTTATASGNATMDAEHRDMGEASADWEHPTQLLEEKGQGQFAEWAHRGELLATEEQKDAEECSGPGKQRTASNITFMEALRDPWHGYRMPHGDSDCGTQRFTLALGLVVSSLTYTFTLLVLGRAAYVMHWAQSHVSKLNQCLLLHKWVDSSDDGKSAVLFRRLHDVRCSAFQEIHRRLFSECFDLYDYPNGSGTDSFGWYFSTLFALVLVVRVRLLVCWPVVCVALVLLWIMIGLTIYASVRGNLNPILIAIAVVDGVLVGGAMLMVIMKGVWANQQISYGLGTIRRVISESEEHPSKHSLDQVEEYLEQQPISFGILGIPVNQAFMAGYGASLGVHAVSLLVPFLVNYCLPLLSTIRGATS